MATHHHQPNPVVTKQLHYFQVSPPSGSLAATSSLPITFFDIPWLNSRPMRRLFFYDFPYPTLHFIQSILPDLRRSLSLALQHFFPLAGNLVTPPPPQLPFLLFSSSSDSVPLTIAESTADVDYDQLTWNNPRDVRELHPLVPEMNPPSVRSEDGARLSPLLALQVTVFPNKGLCIGVQFHHIAADGRAFHHFMKFWAALLRSGACDVSSCSQIPLPSHHRELIRDNYGDMEAALLKQWFDWLSTWNYDAGAARYLNLSNKVRSTFVITKPNLDKLKGWVQNVNPKQAHISAFVVTCALIWVNLIKSEGVGDLSDDPNRVYHLGFSADYRGRLGIELPETYFGNCLGLIFIGEKRGELAGGGEKHGFVRAAEVIGKRVSELGRERGGVGDAEGWMPKWREVAEGGRVIVIAGSPKLKAYETDFGWGRPRKSEVVQVDSSRSVALCESADGNGGVEVGLALDRNKMKVFTKLFEEFLLHI